MQNASSYYQLAQRIQTAIQGANHRECRQVHLRPEDGDNIDAWHRIISEIDENENVEVTRTPEGWLVGWMPAEA